MKTPPSPAHPQSHRCQGDEERKLSVIRPPERHTPPFRVCLLNCIISEYRSLTLLYNYKVYQLQDFQTANIAFLFKKWVNMSFFEFHLILISSLLIIIIFIYDIFHIHIYTQILILVVTFNLKVILDLCCILGN